MKKYIFLIFGLIFPYGIIGALGTLMNDNIMNSVFNNNGLLLIAALLGLWVIGFIGNTLTIIIAFRNKWDAYELAKINMLIKLAQAPAYVAIFVVGLICMITIFTALISFALFIANCLAICLTGIFGCCALIRGWQEHKVNNKTAIILGLGQFIFCVDIVSAVILFLKCKKTI